MPHLLAKASAGGPAHQTRLDRSRGTREGDARRCAVRFTGAPIAASGASSRTRVAAAPASALHAQARSIPTRNAAAAARGGGGIMSGGGSADLARAAPSTGRAQRVSSSGPGASPPARPWRAERTPVSEGAVRSACRPGRSRGSGAARSEDGARSALRAFPAKGAVTARPARPGASRPPRPRSARQKRSGLSSPDAVPAPNRCGRASRASGRAGSAPAPPARTRHRGSEWRAPMAPHCARHSGANTASSRIAVQDRGAPGPDRHDPGRAERGPLRRRSHGGPPQGSDGSWRRGRDTRRTFSEKN